MTEVNNISSSQSVSPVNIEKIKSQRAFQGHPKDTVDISTKKTTAQKVGLVVASMGLLATAAGLTYMIGRNPAKAAKVLKGNENVVNSAYEEGLRITDEIMSKKGSFKTTLDSVLSVFKKPEYRSNLSEHIENVEKYIKEHNIAEDSEIGKALKSLKENLNKHLSQSEQNLMHGVANDYDTGKKFIEANKTDLKTISDYLKDEHLWDLSFSFNPGNVFVSDLGLHDFIRECPKELLPKDGIFYHGTTNAKSLYEGGMTPFVSKQLNHSARELGAGVYVTPDPRVAAYFSGLQGNIVPVKMGEASKIALVTENSYKSFLNATTDYMLERLPIEEFNKYPQEVQSAIRECCVRRMFKEAGYDAAYIPKAVENGGLFSNVFNPDMNKVIGANQSQVIVFSPESLTIVPRSLKERVCDVKQKITAYNAHQKWLKEHPHGF